MSSSSLAGNFGIANAQLIKQSGLFERGVRVSLAMALERNLIVNARSVPFGKPHDGHPDQVRATRA